MEERKQDTLLKKEFMIKVIYNRLSMKYRINDVYIDEIAKMIPEFEQMIEEIGATYDVMNFEPLTKAQFSNIVKQFTIRLQRNTKLIPAEATFDQINEEYMTNVTESILWGYKMYIYCSHFAHDKCIMTVPSLRSIRGPFYTLGYTTLLDLALVFANTNDSSNLKGIGPDKYIKFKKFFAMDCTEFSVVEG